MNKVLISYKYRIVISIHYTAYADNINNSPIEESVSGFTTFMQEMLSVFSEKGVHRRVHLTQMVKQVILNGSTQNVIITEKTIKRPEIYF